LNQCCCFCCYADGQPLPRSITGGSSLATAAAAAAAEDEFTLLRINADNTLLLDALEQQAPRSVRNTVSYLEVRLVLITHFCARLLCKPISGVTSLLPARSSLSAQALQQCSACVHWYSPATSCNDGFNAMAQWAT
jgi:hypothetical protein